MPSRIGFGYDSHRLVEGKPLIIGTVEIPFNKGCLAHSDGDVLIHAIIDAMLGALSLGDIGQHFPDDDPKFKNVSSVKLLEATMEKITALSYKISNIDTTIILESPSLKPYAEEMKKSLSSIQQIDLNQISIKTKTNEKMEFVGKGEGIACYAVVLVEMC